MSGSEPLVLGSNPGGAALDCSGQWCPTGLENQAGVTPRGFDSFALRLDCMALGAKPPAKGLQSNGWWFDSTALRSLGAGTQAGL